MGYVPPQLRHNVHYKSRDLSLKPKMPVIDYSKIKTPEQIFEEIRKQNYGKADSAWGN